MCSTHRKGITSILYYVAIAIIIFVLIKDCTNKPKDRVVIKEVEKIVTIPEKVVQFDTIVKLKPYYVQKENPVNKELLDKYDSLKDSLKRDLFKKAVTKNTYKEKFENDTVVVDVFAETTGTLDKLTTNVKIKPMEFSYKEKEITYYKYPKLSIYAGAGVLSRFDNVNGTVFTGHLGVVNKKGLHIELSYNTRKEWGIAIKKDIFTKY